MVWGSKDSWEGSCPCPMRVLGVPATHEAPWDEMALLSPKGGGEQSPGHG